MNVFYEENKKLREKLMRINQLSETGYTYAPWVQDKKPPGTKPATAT